MTVNKEKILQAFDKFLEDDVIKHMKEMPKLEQFLFGMKVGVVRRKAPELIDLYLNKPEITQLGIVKDGKIDIDIIYNAALDSMKNLGSVQIDVLKFDETDIRKLYDLIKE